MDKSDLFRLLEGARELGVPLSEEAGQALLRLREDLLRWNRKVSLTAITQPDEVLEKHFLDSLAVSPDVPPGARLLDVGSGAGFPGLPLALARADLSVTMVDAVAKKVGFVKQAAATLGLAPRAQALHVRLGGAPAQEGLGSFDVAVARALADLPAWLALARPYVRPGGRVLAMLAAPPANAGEVAQGCGLALVGLRGFRLPWSGAPRTVASFEVPRGT